ncbi:hypothetical protein V7056_17565 [Bacillus sp. JJ664]
MDKVKLNYGKYEIPKTLNEIIDFQKQLKSEGLLAYDELMGFDFSLAEIDTRYLNTPVDVIQFASPGVDGVHFGFLTDFGQVKDLEDAYIIRVSPMDSDDPVRIVARNIHDFLRLLCFAPDALFNVDVTTSEEYIKENPELATFQAIDDIDLKISDRVRQRFFLEPIRSLNGYMQKVKLEREDEIVLPTEDSIGVINKNITNKEEIQKQDLFDFKRAFYREDVKQFFKTSSNEARLVFLRDALSQGLLYDDDGMKLILQEQLRLMQLEDEAVRVMY